MIGSEGSRSLRTSFTIAAAKLAFDISATGGGVSAIAAFEVDEPDAAFCVSQWKMEMKQREADDKSSPEQHAESLIRSRDTELVRGR